MADTPGPLPSPDLTPAPAPTHESIAKLRADLNRQIAIDCGRAAPKTEEDLAGVEVTEADRALLFDLEAIARDLELDSEDAPKNLAVEAVARHRAQAVREAVAQCESSYRSIVERVGLGMMSSPPATTLFNEIESSRAERDRLKAALEEARKVITDAHYLWCTSAKNANFNCILAQIDRALTPKATQ